MRFRIATLNLEQSCKNWQQRRRLVAQQLAELNPDLLALNEIHVRNRPAAGCNRRPANNSIGHTDCCSSRKQERRDAFRVKGC